MRDKKNNGSPRAVITWLVVIELLILLMIAVGGITRLTDSGLSMVEWKPLLGAIPPLNEADWQTAFEKYQAYPQFQQVNSGMDLEAFKGIYFWEYLHRVLGRVIGLVFALPLLAFTVLKKIPKGFTGKCWIAFFLGGLQGVLGWFMVTSGLLDEPRVSHFRLAAHLLLAFVVFAYILWLIRALRPGDEAAMPAPKLRRAGYQLLALLVVQIIYGAFVAGTDAGYAYNTFPKMLGYWVHPDARQADSVFAALLFNPATIQFLHRTLAWSLVAGVALFYGMSFRTKLSRAQRNPFHVLTGLMVLQFLLGIVTLVTHVPKHVAVTHQVTACLLMGVMVWLLHALGSNQAALAATAEQSEA